MSGYSHILLAVDFNQHTNQVVQRGVQLQRTFGSSLTLIHVVEFVQIDLSNDLVMPQELEMDQELVLKEREIYRNQALQEGKPENIVDRIAEGMVSKFLKDNTLLNQEFTKDSKKTVGQYLKEAAKDVTVTGFKRFSLK